ncbi:hypothetical protein FQA39_LY10388 [Lamprigera yunnana]|nr:hypothetical protein FQA39_LY10388 [Lamprigera yunnana]
MEHTERKKPKKDAVKQKLNIKRKLSKKNKHKARLIVRNLPFAVTEENLREHFEKFGEIDEIKLLKREDGTVLGCGFVQFKLVQKAAKARHHLDHKMFLDREIECDWALPKHRYERGLIETAEDVKIKEEPLVDGYEIKVDTVKEEIKEEIEDSKIDVTNDSVNENNIDMEETYDSEDEQPLQENEEELSGDDDSIHISEYSKDIVMEKKSKPLSQDVCEGKTVFIKNIPFSATNEDVKKCMSQFGPLLYAVVCINSLTEYSRGTAFAKFKDKADAEKCLEEKAIKLMGNVLECKPALSKEEILNKSNQKQKGPRDSRNLYLLKEGLILAGSKAAESVSATDIAKRLQLEQYKTQTLKNLNMFVARTRLIVHNIPFSWSDAQLRKLFQKHCGPKGVIKEARIMRNMRRIEADGLGKSKEYGFVTFTTHEAALQALRSLNNNPNIFNVNKRPIVAFSIENRSKLQTKERRAINSKLKNPQSKCYNPAAVKEKVKKDKRSKYEDNRYQVSDAGIEKYSGIKASFGNNKMRSKFNLRTEAQMHLEQVKKDKRRKKMATTKQPLKQKQKVAKSMKIKRNAFKIDDNFSKLITNYKQKLLNAGNANFEKQKKWYE